MEQQIARILELTETIYEKSNDEEYITEIWESLSQAWYYTKDKRVKEALLKYFYYPQRNKFQKKYEQNRVYLMKSQKVYGYDFKEDKDRIYVLREKDEVIYYLKDDEICQVDLSYQCKCEETERVMYFNVLPGNLPFDSKFPFILYYDKEVFACCMQIDYFTEILEKNVLILVDCGLEEYIQQEGNIGYKVVEGYGAEKLISRAEAAVKKYLYVETQKTFGSLYKNHTFYVIRIKSISSSLGALILWVLIQLKIVEEKGYIPVIDFSGFWNVFLEDDELGIVNPWEYYFEQPTQFSLAAAYHAKNVVLGTADAYHSTYDLDTLIENEKVLKEYSRLFNKYIHISKRVEKKSMIIFENLIDSCWKILGVVYRGTDYRNRPVPGENRQPDMEELLQKTTKCMENWNCDHIFLATEDKGAVKRFRDKFGDKMVCIEKERYDSAVEYTWLHKFQREFDAYLKGEEYLTEIYILSKCNCLLSGRCGILSVVLPMNSGKYERKYIYDLGLRTMDDYE